MAVLSSPSTVDCATVGECLPGAIHARYFYINYPDFNRRLGLGFGFGLCRCRLELGFGLRFGSRT